jgi:hypothetical protein
VHAYELLDKLRPCAVVVQHWADAKKLAPVKRADPTFWVRNVSEECVEVKKSFVEFAQELLRFLATP